MHCLMHNTYVCQHLVNIHHTIIFITTSRRCLVNGQYSAYANRRKQDQPMTMQCHGKQAASKRKQKMCESLDHAKVVRSMLNVRRVKALAV